MAQITLHNDRDASATYVSNNFIDYYMTAANGEYVKIYLYLLRCMNSTDCSFSLSSVADKFDHTEKDVQRALKYWEKMKLLRLEYNTQKELSGIYFLDSEAPSTEVSGDRSLTSTTEQVADLANSAPKNITASIPEAEEQAFPVAESAEPVKRNYTAAELAAFQEKEAVSELLFVTEHYLKRPLTPTDLNTIFFWYDELAFPVNLIEYLVEYCLGKGHNSLRYMEKVALSWKKEGINTVERAKCASSAFSQIHFTVMRALGISGRNLVPSETTLIDKWSKSYGFTADIITEACRRTITATHQPSFEYTDGILDRWHKQNVHHLSDIAKLDSDYQNTKKSTAVGNKSAAPNKFHNFKQRTYDYDKLEQQLLQQPKGQEVTCP